MHAVAHHMDKDEPVVLIHEHDAMEEASQHQHDHHAEYAMVYSDLIEDKIDAITEVLKQRYPDMKNYRWHALKLLEQDADIMARYPVDLPQVMDRSYEKDIINQKYDFIEEIIDEVLMNKEQKAERTDKIDGLLTHPIWGVPHLFRHHGAGIWPDLHRWRLVKGNLCRSRHRVVFHRHSQLLDPFSGERSFDFLSH